MSGKSKTVRHDLMARRDRLGYAFIAPFLIGFLFLIAIPIVQSVIFSFHDIQIVESGYTLVPKGLKNYRYILLVNTEFRAKMVESFQMTVRDTLIVVPFSFFAALILHKPFHGRTLARAIFFLPVVVSSGVFAVMDANTVINMVLSRDPAVSTGSLEATESALAFVNTLFAGSLPAEITQFVAAATGNISGIVAKSGIQIILFLGGLNTISPSIYESSNIEGATAWVNFWKITFPMSGPYILLNVVYTVIDSFTNINNPLIKSIWNDLTGLKNFGVASASAWLYFILIFAVLGVTFALISRKVFYRD
ncbi:MAG: sugar ABC transporter permease [Clostridiales bacterium]|nr:sugar ABC transporter permease [Clostridiales bacterium]